MLRSIRHRLALFTYSWRTIGPASLLRSSLSWAADREARTVDSGFDQLHGTDTGGVLTPAEAAIPSEHRGAATLYVPTMDCDLAAMLAALPWPGTLRRQAAFVDLGSGKARAVLLAAMHDFREVVGVELSPVLHAAAARNHRRLRAAGRLRAPVRLVLGDATRFEPPPGPFVTYLYHPFRQPLAAAVVEGLVASLAGAPRPAAILYCHPTLQPPYCRSVFTTGDVFALAAEGARHTRRFRLGWSVWSNQAWLAGRAGAEPGA